MNEKITIGKIVSAVGLKGEVKLYHYSGNMENIKEGKSVLVGNDLTEIEKVRLTKNTPILKLVGIDDRNAAEALRGTLVSITEGDLEELPEGEYYVRDLIGLKVCNQDGEVLGQISDVLQNAGQDLYEVKDERGHNFLIPAVEEFINNIDIDNGEITVTLPKGLIEL